MAKLGLLRGIWIASRLVFKGSRVRIPVRAPGTNFPIVRVTIATPVISTIVVRLIC